MGKVTQWNMVVLALGSLWACCLSAFSLHWVCIESQRQGGFWRNTVNVNIFACIHFREFDQNENFAWIYISVFDIIVSILHKK